MVDCSVSFHGNFWTLSTMVYPADGNEAEKSTLIENHWARTFSWTDLVGRAMASQGAPWENAINSVRARARASAVVLEPLMRNCLQKVSNAKQQLMGEPTFHDARDVVSAFSYVRLKPGFVGLTEPPSDRRPYTVVSISPRVAKEGTEYLMQVVLHECLHIAVASNGGDPHNAEFEKLAEFLGLDPEYRD